MQLRVDVGMNNERRAGGTCFVNESKPGVTAKHGCQFRRLLVVPGIVLGREKTQLNIRCIIYWHLDDQRRAFLTDSVPQNEAKTLNACRTIASLDVTKFARDKFSVKIFLTN